MDDRNCQSTVCSDKTCQDTKFIHMQPVQPSMKKSGYMQLAKPAILQSDYKKKKCVCDDNKCQSTKAAKSVCDDKNSPATQCIHMQPAMKSSYLQLVTKPSHMCLPKPTMKQSTYKKFNQDDKNCQSTKKHRSEECPVRPVCNDKNCQSAKCVHMQKSAMPQSKYKKVTHPTQLCRKQIGTQSEITRNCQDSTSKCCYQHRNTNVCPEVVKSQSNYTQPVMPEPKKSQVNTRLQVIYYEKIHSCIT